MQIELFGIIHEFLADFWMTILLASGCLCSIKLKALTVVVCANLLSALTFVISVTGISLRENLRTNSHSRNTDEVMEK